MKFRYRISDIQSKLQRPTKRLWATNSTTTTVIYDVNECALVRTCLSSYCLLPTGFIIFLQLEGVKRCNKNTNTGNSILLAWKSNMCFNIILYCHSKILLQYFSIIFESLKKMTMFFLQKYAYIFSGYGLTLQVGEGLFKT